MTEQIIEVGEKVESPNEKQQDHVLDKRQAQIERMYSPHGIEFTPIIFSLVTVLVIYWGWQAELENYITPESGLGYALGIIAGVTMLLMVVYSMRKRVKWMREWGAVRYWFKAHMVFGIIGPVIALYHCNFQLGSQNSTMSLISMFLVVVSGIVGRYLYGRIHFGAYGNEMTLQQLQQDKLIARYELSRLFEISPQLYEKINKYDNIMHSDSQNLITGFFQIYQINLQTRVSNFFATRMLVKSCKQAASAEGWKRSKVKEVIASGKTYLKAHYSTIRKLVGLTFFDRLFSLWDLLHVPFFSMLIFTTIIHIIAVHMY